MLVVCVCVYVFVCVVCVCVVCVCVLLQSLPPSLPNNHAKRPNKPPNMREQLSTNIQTSPRTFPNLQSMLLSIKHHLFVALYNQYKPKYKHTHATLFGIWLHAHLVHIIVCRHHVSI